MQEKTLLLLAAIQLSLTPVLHASESTSGINITPRFATDEVENQITMDRESNPLYESIFLAPLQEWKKAVAERTGFNWGLDYNSLIIGVSESLGKDSASSGAVRFYGFWDLIDRGGKNKGSLNWKVENRHKYSDIAPSNLGFESGYVGVFEPTFSNQENRLTNLYWKQYFAEGKWTAVAGFLDSTDFVDVYLLASPWTGFNNLVFSTGSATIDLPNDGALGIGVGGMIGGQVYIHAGITDANSDPTDPFAGFNSVADESDFFKWVEVGLTPGLENIYFDNIHLTLWHVDERANGTTDGWGLNASWQKWLADTWLPFVRGGYTDDSGSLLERSVSIGIGYQPIPMRGVIGLAFNYGKPNQTSFAGVEDQYTGEVYYRYQLTKGLAITPSIQYIKDPALNPDESSLWAYGLRVRIAL